MPLILFLLISYWQLLTSDEGRRLSRQSDSSIRVSDRQQYVFHGGKHASVAAGLLCFEGVHSDELLTSWFFANHLVVLCHSFRRGAHLRDLQ